jgi:hypothetical protein
MVNVDLPPTEWNLNSHKINFIGEKMIAAIENFEKGNYPRSFKNNISLKIAISNRLNDKEKGKCEKYELIIPQQILKDKYGKPHLTWEYKTQLQEYIEYIQELIKIKGLDLSEKSESSMF